MRISGGESPQSSWGSDLGAEPWLRQQGGDDIRAETHGIAEDSATTILRSGSRDGKHSGSALLRGLIKLRQLLLVLGGFVGSADGFVKLHEAVEGFGYSHLSAGRIG